MGKYMRKGKGVGKMAVIEEALGVRTRARALALQRDSKQGLTHTRGQAEVDKQHEICASMECCVPSLPLQEEDVGVLPQTNYMELRNRRFEKVSSRVGEEVASQARPELFCKRLSKSSSSNSESYKERKSPQASLQHAARGVSRQVSLQSSAVDAGGVNLKRVTPTASTSDSVSLSARKPLGILTRHQRQALAQLAGPDTMEVEAKVELSSRADIDFNAEGEQFYGESPMVVGPSNKDRHRRRTRESTPDSYAWSMEAPGSTSRTRRARRNQGRSLSAPPFNRANEAPSSSEIEAFFQGAEQQERRRFIERYNFDPVSERPLRGRYEWTNT
ncbi:hypothetical protein L7F22_031293 [Adiantum nelumboides]|nr:hypothetical protein [Adiantum nelumboides]